MIRPTARTAVLLLATALAWVGARSALAQLEPSSNNAPIDMAGDQFEADNKNCSGTWTGNAEALQDTNRLRANSISVYKKLVSGRAGNQAGSGQNCGMLDRMVADGAVYYVTPSQVVKGDHAIYTADTKTIVVTGDVIVAQGHNVMVGKRLVLNTDTGIGHMTSDVTGAGRTGRVRGVFYPQQQSGASGGPAQAGAPSAPVPPPPDAWHGK